MTRKDIVQRLSKRTDISPAQATHALDGIIDIISEALAAQEPVMLRGFGAIKTVHTPERIARDIRRKRVVTIPARMQVKFKAYDQLKLRINGNNL